MIKKTLLTCLFLLLTSTEPTASTEGTLILLNEEASIEVAQTLGVATLRYQVEGQDVAQIQSKVNQTIDDALKTLTKTKSITLKTGTYQVYEKHRKSKTWVAQQSLQLESLKHEAWLQQIGRLQAQGFTLQSIGYKVPDSVAKLYQDTLTKQAISQLKKRLNVIAKELQLPTIVIEKLSIQDSPSHRPVSYLRSMKLETYSPSAEPATDTLKLNVQAEARLSK